MRKVYIIGGKGNLGNQIYKLIPEAICWDSNDLDVTSEVAVQKKLQDLTSEDVVINCAAYNDLDAAEDNPAAAFALNEDAPRFLAEAINKTQSTFIHFSTGYVFSGEQKEVHSENDTPDPNSVYAKSKLAGEKSVENVGGKYYIIRTNLLFGPQGPSRNSKKSVVDVMRGIGTEKKYLRGIVDEQSNFTYTPDLAKATVDILKDRPLFGIYHLVNEGYGNWYELAHQIFTSLGWDVLNEPKEPLSDRAIIIEQISGTDYPRKAKRPTSAVLINTKRPLLRSWQEALNEYLNS